MQDMCTVGVKLAVRISGGDGGGVPAPASSLPSPSSLHGTPHITHCLPSALALSPLAPMGPFSCRFPFDSSILMLTRAIPVAFVAFRDQEGGYVDG